MPRLYPSDKRDASVCWLAVDAFGGVDRVGLGGDVVPGEDRLRLVPRELPGDGLVNPGADQFARG